MSTDDKERDPNNLAADREAGESTTEAEIQPAAPLEDEEFDEYDEPLPHRRIAPGERDEYEEWRRERQERGRKKKGKGGERRRRERDEELF